MEGLGCDGHEEGIKGVDLECGLRIILMRTKYSSMGFRGPLKAY